MVDKAPYLERLKLLHIQKTCVSISDEEALENFERLIALVRAITGHIEPEQIIFSKV